MNFKLKNILAGVLLAFFFSNCEDVIELDLDNVAPQMVIEGNLTDQAGKHRVQITKTVPFDQPNEFPAISGAFVTIGDNTGLLDTLKETSPGIYETQGLTQGIYGRTYTLRALVEGKEYIAVSKMPQRVPFDALSTSTSIFGGSTSQNVIPEFNDPVGLGNFYNFAIIKNGERQPEIYTLSDELSDGKRITRPLLNPGLDLKSGDTCTVEMYCLDPVIFKYFLSIQLTSGNGPGGGTTPANPDNNFGNTCLGYFSAHPWQTKTVVIR
jgi:Domain of unknown function (DUF4249)